MDNVLKHLIKEKIWEGNLPKKQKPWYSTRELQSMLFDYPEMMDAIMIEGNLDVSCLAELVMGAVNEKIGERDGE